MNSQVLKQPISSLTAQIEERLVEMQPPSVYNNNSSSDAKFAQKRKTKTGIEYYNVKKRDIKLENDSSFSQSHCATSDIANEEALGWTKEETLKMQLLQEEQSKILENKSTIRGGKEMQKNALSIEMISSQNMRNEDRELMVADRNPSQTLQATSTSSQQQNGFDVLSDYLRQVQSKKFHFQKASTNFHNTLNFDRNATKNEGGSGNFQSNTHNIQNHMMSPQEIIRGKQSEFDMSTPHHMRFQAASAKNAIEGDKERAFLKAEYSQDKTRDVSYRADAVRSVMEARKKKESSKPVVESSLDKVALNENHKQLLQGIISQQLPHDLTTLELLMKERRFQLNDIITDVDNLFPNRNIQQKPMIEVISSSQEQPKPEKRQPTHSQSQQQIKRSVSNQILNNNQGGNFGLRPATIAEKSIFKKHHNQIMFHQAQSTNHGRFKNFQKNASQTQQSFFNRSQNSKSVSELPTVNIKINTNNYYYSNQANQPLSVSQTGGDAIGSSFVQQSSDQNRMINSNNIFGNPSSRKDAETLHQWFRLMLSKIDNDETLDEDAKNNQKKNVYIGAFQELQKQVAVQCKNRGDLLNELWQGFFKDIQFQLKSLKTRKITEELNLRTEIDDSNLFYLDQLKRKNQELERSHDLLKDLKNKLTDMAQQHDDQKMDAERWKLKCEKLFSKYKENKFKLLNAETQKMKTINNYGVHQTLLFRKQLKDSLEQDDLFDYDTEFKAMLEKQLDSNKVGHLYNISPIKEQKSKKEEEQESPPKKFEPNLISKHQDTLKKLQNKKKKVGVFHSDISTLTAKKNVSLKTYANKAIDTRDLIEQLRVEETTQTVGVGVLLSQLVAEEQKKSPLLRKTTRESISLINFEKDIDNILEQEVILQENDEEEQNQLQRQSSSQATTQISLMNLNVNKVMSNFASGLKTGILQKVIQKLKENFKVKENLLKQVMEENKDLFQQLDIEKAKFSQIIKQQDNESVNIVELQHQLENVQKKFNKERSRHQYYRDLIGEVTELKEVRQKINMSISDIDEGEFKNESSRNPNKLAMTSIKKKSKGSRSGIFSAFGKRESADGFVSRSGNILGDDWEHNEDEEISMFIDDSNDEDEVSSQQERRNKSFKKKRINNSHPSNVFVQKLYKKLQLPKFHKISCSLKALLKIINLSYTNLLTIYKKELPDLKNSFVLKQTCVEFIYDQFIRSAGIKKLSEKKFAQTISAVMRFQTKIQRVKLFGRFMGLFDLFDKESFKFFLICLNYIQSVSTFGYLVPVTDQDEIHYAPYIRVSDFMRTFFESRISVDEFQELKTQIDKLKENDFKKNRNTFIVDQDRAIEILLEQHLKILNNKKGNVQDLFLSFDFENLELINFQAFYLLITHVEERKFTYQQIKELFDKHSELIGVNTMKDPQNLLTLDSFISICFQEKLFNKENQEYFMMINNNNEMQTQNEEISDKIRGIRDHFKRDQEIISQRFQNKVPLYIQELIALVQITIRSNSENINQKAKRTWILYRILLEESKRIYVEQMSSRFMGKLDFYVQMNQGPHLANEEKQLFNVKAYKATPQKQFAQSGLQLTTITNLRPSTQYSDSIASPRTPQKLRTPRKNNK